MESSFVELIIKENVPLAPHTIYKIGGPARFFVEINDQGELKKALAFAAEKKLPVFILGAGSNILVSDKGFDGLVVKMNLRGIHSAGSGRLVADSGVSMAQAVLAAAKAGLTGFEWAIGVPGTMGGSVRGNAGCFGGEMKDVVESVDVFDSVKATSDKRQGMECEFSYRDSIFKKYPELIILSVTLNLKKGDPREIQEKTRRITAERTEKQDIGTKSCGCIFKNISWARKDINKEKLFKSFPELARFRDQPNIPASFLIDQAGLKGRRVGGVSISSKHANYFVNDGPLSRDSSTSRRGEGGATAEEVVMLIAIVKDVARRKYGILLEEEIQYVGF